MKKLIKHLNRTVPTLVGTCATAVAPLTLLALMALMAPLQTSCASRPMAEIPSTANPQEEIARLEMDLKNAQRSDIDVLDFKNYDSAVKYLEEAKSDLASNQKQKEILDDIRYGRGALDAARGQAEYRRTRAPEVLDSRQAAIRAGATNYPELQKEWTRVDREVISDSEDLMKLDSAKLAALQSKYVDLERKATIQGQLGTAMAIIKGARNDGAQSRAGHTLRAAEVDLAAAEVAVSTNVRNELGYQAAVNRADASAKFLGDVMAQLKTSKNMTEATAIQMVQQKRQIAELKNEVTLQKNEAATAESEVRAKKQELSMRGRQLSNAEHKIAMQQALERARNEFSDTDAEAYQQGDNLVIRLKTVAFTVGRSDLPPKALVILSKVSNVAKELDATKIKVEGHTDATGNESQNLALSEARANAVATYLKTTGVDDAQISAEGLGFAKPLATNKTREGRAQNRRVDVIITPGSVAKASRSDGTSAE